VPRELIANLGVLSRLSRRRAPGIGARCARSSSCWQQPPSGRRPPPQLRPSRFRPLPARRARLCAGPRPVGDAHAARAGRRARGAGGRWPGARAGNRRARASIERRRVRDARHERERLRGRRGARPCTCSTPRRARGAICPTGRTGTTASARVLADGTLVISGVRKGIYVWPPGAAAPHLLPGVQGATYGLAGAGHSALSLIGLDGAGLRAVGAPGAGIDRSPLYLDATTAAFTSVSCRGHAQVTTVDLTDTPTRSPRARSTATSTRSSTRAWRTRSSASARRRPLGASRSGSCARRSPLLRRHHRHLRVFASVGFSSDIGGGPELPSPVPELTARLRR
jgi:hypothetical protein